MTDERLAELEKAIAWERKAYQEWKEHYEANKHAEPGSPEHERWLHLSMAHEQASSPVEAWVSDGTVAELIAEVRRLKDRLNHQIEDEVEACRQGKHKDCGRTHLER